MRLRRGGIEMTRRSRRNLPMVDVLEGRRLLSAGDIRAFSYFAPSGSRVLITLAGAGNLDGTDVDPDGALNLVYGGTNAETHIFVNVNRGTAPLRSIEELDLPANDVTGIGGQLVGSLLAPKLDLVANGAINMTSGVGRLQLHSLGANSQVHLRDLPSTFIANSSNSGNNSSGATTVSTVSLTGATTSSAGSGGTVVGSTNSGSATGTSIGNSSGLNGSATNPAGNSTGISGTATNPAGTPTGSNSTSTTAGGGTVSLTGLINNPTGVGVGSTGQTLAQAGNSTVTVTATTIITDSNGNPEKIPAGEEAVALAAPVPAVAPSSYSFAGLTRTYFNDPTSGGTTLTSVTGQFAATPNLITLPNRQNPGPSPPPPGIIVQLTNINGNGGEIGDAQVWGYDAVVNALVRFNTTTGQLLQAVPVGGVATNAAGVGFGRDGRELVVLLARGTVVQAFDASTGAPVGAFSTTDLAGFGFNAVDGIGYTGTVTVLSDSTAQVTAQANGTTDFGVSIGIDVTKSLAGGGLAVPIGTKPFVSDNGFSYSGGATGLAGTNNIYNFGAAIFDSFQSPNRQAGVLTTTGYFTQAPHETTRTPLPNPSDPQGTTPFVNFGGPAGALTGTGPAIGSVEQLLAINEGVANGVNFIRFYVPGTLASAGSVNLQDPDPIVSLSTSFHPELAGSALVDIQGNVTLFSARKATGLALNDNGNLDLVQINDASFSTVIAQPLSHVQIGRRNDVVLVTPNRSVDTRNGVLVVEGLKPLGPLSLPN